jgi:hypothetical protein
MRVYFWSLIALLILLSLPVAAWGVDPSPDRVLIPAMPVAYAGGVAFGTDVPAMYARDDAAMPRPKERPDNSGSLPHERDALPPTMWTEVTASMRSAGRQGRPWEGPTRPLPQVRQGFPVAGTHGTPSLHS